MTNTKKIRWQIVPHTSLTSHYSLLLKNIILHITCLFSWNCSEITLHAGSVFRSPLPYYLHSNKVICTPTVFFFLFQKGGASILVWPRWQFCNIFFTKSKLNIKLVILTSLIPSHSVKECPYICIIWNKLGYMYIGSNSVPFSPCCLIISKTVET